MKDRIFFLVVLMVVLPLLAESIYAPGLPGLASNFSVSDAAAETTLSIYLLGMSMGVLFWGNLSEVLGRKSAVLSGFLIFLCATVACYFTASFSAFLLFRFVQAFGGSASCVSQSVNRDVFVQKERMDLSAKIGTAVSIAPAFGAMLGGIIAHYYTWRESFLCLIVLAIAAIFYFYYRLPETKTDHYLSFNFNDFLVVLCRVLKDSNLLINAMIIGLGLGILYAFMSEGAFYCIENLSISTQRYGIICALGSFLYAFGCRFSSYMIQNNTPFLRLMKWGSGLMACSFLILLICTYIDRGFQTMGTQSTILPLTIIFTVSWMFAQLGLSFILTPCFANALENQRENAGVAASIFAFIYNIISAFVNVIISYWHSDGLYRMPMIFLGIVLIISISCEMLARSRVRHVAEGVSALT